MRTSVCQSPGNSGCSSTGIVFTYGVLTGYGTLMPAARRRFTKLSRKNGACSAFWVLRTCSTTNSSGSSHLFRPVALAGDLAPGPALSCNFDFTFDRLNVNSEAHNLNGAIIGRKQKESPIARSKHAITSVSDRKSVV